MATSRDILFVCVLWMLGCGSAVDAAPAVSLRVNGETLLGAL